MIVKHALRSLRRTPAFTIAAILTLLLGIASAGSMFAVVHGVLLAPLPYGEPERLVSIGLQATAQQRMQQPPAAYFTYRQFAQQLAGIGFYRTGNANIGTEGVDEVPASQTRQLPHAAQNDEQQGRDPARGVHPSGKLLPPISAKAEPLCTCRL